MEIVAQVQPNPRPQTMDLEAEASTSEKPLSKGARKRRNKRLKNQQQEENISSAQLPDSNGKTKKKLSIEEKNQRKKIFVSKINHFHVPFLMKIQIHCR